MKDILTQICNKKKEELKESKLRCSYSSLKKLIQNKKIEVLKIY